MVERWSKQSAKTCTRSRRGTAAPGCDPNRTKGGCNEAIGEILPANLHMPRMCRGKCLKIIAAVVAGAQIMWRPTEIVSGHQTAATERATHSAKAGMLAMRNAATIACACALLHVRATCGVFLSVSSHICSVFVSFGGPCFFPCSEEL